MTEKKKGYKTLLGFHMQTRGGSEGGPMVHSIVFDTGNQRPATGQEGILWYLLCSRMSEIEQVEVVDV